MRYNYAALLTMCDRYLGKILHTMDVLTMWEDTMLIVCTDHGFLLGEHGCWAKLWPPFYNEIAHTPLFIYDLRSRSQNRRSNHLVQLIDLGPTLLEFFGQQATPDMQGCSLRETLASDAPTRDYILFGTHGVHVCVTDGRYILYARTGQRRKPTTLRIYADANSYAKVLQRRRTTGHPSGGAFSVYERLPHYEDRSGKALV